MNSKIVNIYERILSFVFIPNWLIPTGSKTLLDIGCGNGLPMKLIKYRFKDIKSMGIDGFKPYIDILKGQSVHTRYRLVNLEKSSLPRGNFDVVMCLQVIEHLSKKRALRLIRESETMAKKLVIFSTPIGKTEYSTDDGNDLQNHKSHFFPEDFEKLGYKIIRMGGKRLFSESGLIHKTKTPIIRKLIISLDIACVPFYLLRQSKSDYYFFAYKFVK